MRRALFVCAGAALAVTATLAQTSPSPPVVKPQTVRTPWGDPDLQGVWNYAAGTPLERPDSFNGREFMTDEELTQAERAVHQRNSADRPDGGGSVDVNREVNEFWFARRSTILTKRTSLIIDPPDGKLPSMTDDAERKRTANTMYVRDHPADSWETRRLNERCITFLQSGPPIIPSSGPNDELLLGVPFHFQIFQARGYVALRHEELNLRIIPLDGRPHLPHGVGQWLGDSRGRWDGDTLIVETTNFREGRLYAGAVTTAQLRLSERFRRVNAETIDYQFTVNDPTTWTKPWTATLRIGKTDGQIYEFACHEGNYALRNILSTARALESRR